MPEPMKVRILNDGSPVAGATVIMGDTGYSKVTDAEGTCAFPELEPSLPMAILIYVETTDGNRTFTTAKLQSGKTQDIHLNY